MPSIIGLYSVVVGTEASNGGSGNTGAKIVAGGVEIMDDDATWLLDGKMGAGSCFFPPFLAIGEYCRAR